MLSIIKLKSPYRIGIENYFNVCKTLVSSSNFKPQSNNVLYLVEQLYFLWEPQITLIFAFRTVKIYFNSACPVTVLSKTVFPM